MFLRSILDVPFECLACGWKGPAVETEPDVDGDGRMGCPQCNTVVVPVER